MAAGLAEDTVFVIATIRRRQRAPNAAPISVQTMLLLRRQ
jgi:hypothetical protein